MTPLLRIGKAHGDLFKEFEDAAKRSEHRGFGDVKFHRGFSAEVETMSGGSLHVSLAFNPSHLEFVNPVVEGIVRAKGSRRNKSRLQVGQTVSPSVREPVSV